MTRAPHSDDVTVERLERARRTVAQAMLKHDMDLMPTIRQLETERDRLRQKTAAMDYAREILLQRCNKGSNTTDRKAA